MVIGPNGPPSPFLRIRLRRYHSHVHVHCVQRKRWSPAEKSAYIIANGTSFKEKGCLTKRIRCGLQTHVLRKMSCQQKNRVPHLIKGIRAKTGSPRAQQGLQTLEKCQKYIPDWAPGDPRHPVCFQFWLFPTAGPKIPFPSPTKVPPTP